MSSKTIKACVFTHHDLDGAVSLLVLKWFLPDLQLDVITVRNVFEFRERFLNWFTRNKITDYSKIFILDLDVSGNEDLIDKPEFFIVDHHETHKKAKYKQASAHIVKYSSACKLLYKVLKEKYPKTKLSDFKKYLICLADDYDSYTLKSPLSKLVNILFWNYNNNFDTFCTEFKDGINKLSSQQISIIKLYAKDFKKYKQQITEVYTGELEYNNKKYTVCSFFADKYINDLADHFFNYLKPDVIIMYNPKTKKIYMRRRRSDDIDIHIGNLCEQWGGGGHEGAGGAPVGEQFFELSKSLSIKTL